MFWNIHPPSLHCTQVHSSIPFNNLCVLLVPIKTTLCYPNILDCIAFCWCVVSSLGATLLEKNSLSISQQLTFVNSFIGWDHVPNFSLDAGIYSGLGWPRFCACCYNCHEFTCVAPLLCLKDVSLWLSISSGSASPQPPLTQWTLSLGSRVLISFRVEPSGVSCSLHSDQL